MAATGPLGSICDEPGVTLATIPLEPGYWRYDTTSIDVLKCPYELACPGNVSVECPAGHRLPYCYHCVNESHYFEETAQACTECDTAWDAEHAALRCVVPAPAPATIAAACCHSLLQRRRRHRCRSSGSLS